MRQPLPARLALIALLGCGIAALPGSARAEPAIMAPQPPTPPVPPSLQAPLTASGTLVIPATCLDRMSVVGGEDAHIVSGSGRLNKHGDRLTFTTSAQDCSTQDNAVIMVPAQTGIEILSPRNNLTTYRISGVNGEVTAVTGRGDLEVDQAVGLTLNMEGSGTVSVRHVTGRLTVQNLASGDLHIDSITATSANLTAMSSGDIRIGQGDTDVLTVRDYGSSDIVLNTRTRDADVTLMGSGDVTLQKVSETLKKRPLGSGTISVTESTGARITTSTTPDSSAILSDTARKVFNSFHIQLGNPDEDSESSVHTRHHFGGHGLIGLLLKIALTVWAVRLFRRYRRTGVLPFRSTLDKAAAGYAEGMRSWSLHRTGWRNAPAATATTVMRDTVTGFSRQKPEPTEDFSRSVPPGHPLARLQDRLVRMERRLGLMEQFVTSPDFSLERQFRDLERADGRRA
ncbi:GIN domain-containing protein [Gluconobacter sphaericus]|uniref:GIN domain-containing protein n=1 Tax=Gluconobacter sphaericus TaxID=574987 RepID=UPI00312B4781